jgi:hypothetical protein
MGLYHKVCGDLNTAKGFIWENQIIRRTFKTPTRVRLAQTGRMTKIRETGENKSTRLPMTQIKVVEKKQNNEGTLKTPMMLVIKFIRCFNFRRVLWA